MAHGSAVYAARHKRLVLDGLRHARGLCSEAGSASALGDRRRRRRLLSNDCGRAQPGAPGKFAGPGGGFERRLARSDESQARAEKLSSFGRLSRLAAEITAALLRRALPCGKKRRAVRGSTRLGVCVT